MLTLQFSAHFPVGFSWARESPALLPNQAAKFDKKVEEIVVTAIIAASVVFGADVVHSLHRGKVLLS